MPATIKDIAKALNLSVSTVSYALNGGPKPVSAAVRDRVSTAAQELGYQPNQVARSLVMRKTGAVGVVLPQLERDAILGSFVQASLNEIINQAEDYHYDILLMTAYDRTVPESLQRIVLDSRVDGVILLAPPEIPELFELMRVRKFPFAAVAGVASQHGPTYAVDNVLGSKLAMQYLWDLGHRKIAHVAGRPNLADAKVRLNTYRDFLHDKGVKVPDGYEVSAGYRRSESFVLCRPLLTSKNRPTAVFCGNDEMAIGLILAAKELGIRVPEDLSVIGFDDTSDSATSEPSLSTIRQPIAEMAIGAFQDVASQIDGCPPSQGNIFRPVLVARKSCMNPKEDLLP